MNFRPKTLLALLAMTLPAFFSPRAAAQTYIWQGGNGNWNSENWNYGGSPSTVYDTIVDSGTATISTSGGAKTLYTGYAATGGVAVMGTLLQTTSAVLGNSSGANGTINMSAGSWTLGGSITVGNSGIGTLSISGGAVDGGTISNAISLVDIGNNAGSDGSMTIASGSIAVGAIYVGNSGTGALNINLGAVVDGNPSISVARSVGSSGTLNVSSGTLSASVAVGISGTGTLNLNGATITTPGEGIAVIGYGAGSNSSATVTNGTWSAEFEFNIGLSGTGTLTMNSGSVSSNYMEFGDVAGSKGSGVISGGTLNAAPTTVAAYLIVGGGSGTGSLLVNGSGYVTSTHSVLGDAGSSSGSAAITSGSWISTGSFEVGNRGTGLLNVQGGLLTSGSGAVIGNTDAVSPVPSSGTANVTSGSWNNAANLAVGTLTGTGVLNISNTGYVSDVNGFVGTGTANAIPNQGYGSATVTSGTWSNSGTLTVGDVFSTGTLVVNGGYVSCANGLIDSGSSQVPPSATVSSGTWVASGTLFVGNSGTGVLNINGTGVVNVNNGTGTMVLANAAASTGTLSFGGGTLAAATVTSGSGTAVVDFNTGPSGVSTFSPNLTGTLNVEQTGQGTTVLTGNCSYSGTLTISAGALTLANPLAVSGSYGQAAATALNLTINSTASYDSISTGTAALNGTLNVAGSAYASGASPGDIFTLVNASSGLSGRFSSINLPTLQSGLQWYVAYNSTSLVATVYSLETLASGSPFTFTANPPGSGPFTYQWYLNGAIIGGATNATYSADAASSGTYSVVSTNDGVSSTDYFGLDVTPAVDALSPWGLAAMALLLCLVGGRHIHAVRGKPRS